MKRILVLDFETASGIELRKCGSWAYAEHPTTEIICVRYRFATGGEMYGWVPGDVRGDSLLDALAHDPDVIFAAHKADFEKAIWRRIMVDRFGFPDIPNERWHDTMSVCAMKALPQKLDVVTRVLRLPHLKDAAASKVVIAMSKPATRGPNKGYYDRSPEKRKIAYDYCAGDVDAQIGLHHRVGWLTEEERRVWLLDQAINERGVRFDLPYIHACREVVRKATGPLAAEFQGITGGLNFTQRDKIMAWCLAEGVKLPDMTKETLKRLLGADEEDMDHEDDPDEDADEVDDVDLPPAVHRALSIRRLIGSASIKKLPSMELYCGSDSRARGLLQYHGAAPGLWAGRGPQPQNYPRGSLIIGDKPPEPWWLVDAIMTEDPDYVACLFGPPVEAVVSGLRHAIVAAPGKMLLVGDFSQIQARIVLGLAGQYDKVAMLARTGSATYLDMASKIYGRPIDKHADLAEYTIGKNTVLGCGFQMGARKFRLRYAPKQPIAFSEGVVDTYRKEWAPMVPKLWWALQDAALQTVITGKAHEAYGVEYRLEDGWLTARIPSGRKIWYWNPQLVSRPMPWDANDIRPAWMFQSVVGGRLKNVDAFGGILTQHVVTGIARDILKDAMFRAEANGLPIVLTVHDEVVTEVDQRLADRRALTQIMAELNPWATALRVPIAAECWSGDRYKK